MTSKSITRQKETLLLTVSGIFSGLVVVCGSNLGGQLWNAVLPGVAFGAAISLCFSVSGRLHDYSKVLRITALTTAAYIGSILLAGSVQLFLPGETGSMGNNATVSPVSVFVGGVFGALMILGVIPSGTPIGVKPHPFQIKMLCWALFGGTLGAVGWLLGPYLGMAIRLCLHALGFTPPEETYQNALYGQTARQYSLYIVWHTGIAFGLGFMLHRGQTGFGSGDHGEA